MKNDKLVVSEMCNCENEIRKYNGEGDTFDVFVRMMQNRFKLVTKYEKVLYKTDCKNLFNEYLSHLPNHMVQYYNCRTCKRFLEKYGDLVVIDSNGVITPVMWNSYINNIDHDFGDSEYAMYNKVKNSNIVSPFYDSKTIWEPTHDHTWTHFKITPPHSYIYKNRLKTPNQMMAEKIEDFKTLSFNLGDRITNIDVLETGLTILKTFNSDKVESKFSPIIKKYIDLKNSLKSIYNYKTFNLKWKFVGENNTNDCNLRSSVVGTLLEDIVAGYDLDTIKNKFSNKISGINYMRPKSLKEGNIDEANKIIEKLGMEKSFERRFARFDELDKIWVPKNIKEPTGKLFDKLKKKSKNNLNSNNEILITGERFLNEIIPNANKMEIHCSVYMNFCAITTAVYENSPCIYKHGNHFSTYVYHSGSSWTQWNINCGWNEIKGVVYKPGNANDSYILIIKNCIDTYNNTSAIFPELLIPELHSIRSTIEKFSKSSKLSGYYENEVACGISIIGNNGGKVKVHMNGVSQVYKIDRYK